MKFRQIIIDAKPFKIGTLNIGSLIRKGREVVDVLERRKLDVPSIQETRWKGSKTREMGSGSKLFYNGADARARG